MKQIEKQMNEAINAGRNFKRSNTEVYQSEKSTMIFLHGNLICRINKATGRRQYSCRGWHTVTTRSRLNALGANVQMQQGTLIYRDTGETVSNKYLPED